MLPKVYQLKLLVQKICKIFHFIKIFKNKIWDKRYNLEMKSLILTRKMDKLLKKFTA